MGDILDSMNALADDDDDGRGLTNSAIADGHYMYNGSGNIGIGGWDKPAASMEYNDTTVTVAGGDLVLEEKDGTQINVNEFIKTMNDRFCVLQPNFEAMEEYPALKDAYDQYKMLEKLLMENNGNKK
jgi:hypothetical protein